MKGLLSKTLILGSILVFTASAAMATETTTKTTSKHTASTTHHGKWICKTNASSTITGEKANKTIANHPKTAQTAFNYAYENCHNCTRITCSVETKTAEKTSTTTTETKTTENNDSTENKTAENDSTTDNNAVKQE